MADSDDKNDVSNEDQAVWEAYIKDMRSKDDEGDEEEDFQALLDMTGGHEQEDVKQPVSKVSVSPSRHQGVADNAVIKQRDWSSPSQLDRRTEDKLRKGKMPIEDRLDLHGMTQAQAHDNLNRFIVGCYHGNLRCVLVITGKGKSKSTSKSWLSPSKGVLKENVPLWLGDHPLKDIVLKFFKAQPKDGGSGALYVYLKRKR